MRKNRKGSVDDVVWIASLLLTVTVVLLIAAKLSGQITAELTSNPVVNDTKAKSAVTRIDRLYGNALDKGILFLTVGLAVVALAFATMVRVHPVFFAFYFIALIIIIVLSAVFSNIYVEMANVDALQSIATDLSFATHIMKYLPFIVGVFGFVIAIVMYNKWRESSAQG